jgi:competence protein ComEA
VATPSERRALLFVAAVAALGLGVRGLRVLGAGQGDPDARAALAAQIAAVDSAVTSGGRPRRARAQGAATGSRAAGNAKPATATTAPPDPPRARPSAPPSAPTGPIDVDRAGAAELDRLPGIGPALAERIIEDREANGPFGSVDGLQRVRGIGPALAARLAPLVTFSGLPRPPRAP